MNMNEFVSSRGQVTASPQSGVFLAKPRSITNLKRPCDKVFVVNTAVRTVRANVATVVDFSLSSLSPNNPPPANATR